MLQVALRCSHVGTNFPMRRIWRHGGLWPYGNSPVVSVKIEGRWIKNCNGWKILEYRSENRRDG